MRWRKKRKNGKFFIFYYLVWRSSFIIRNGQQAEDGRQGRKSSRTVENVVYPWFKSLNQITDTHTQPYLLIKRNLTRVKCEFNFSAPLAQQRQLLATSLRFSSYRCCHLNGAILMDCDRWSSAAAEKEWESNFHAVRYPSHFCSSASVCFPPPPLSFSVR